MKFETRYQCDLWCRIHNQLPLKIEKACYPFAAKAGASGDGRMQKLSRKIYRMAEQFRHDLHEAMTEIENDTNPTKPKETQG